MKRVIFIACVLTQLFSSAMGQDHIILPFDSATGKIVYTNIVKVDSTINSRDIYNAFKEWISSDISTFYIISSEKSSNTTDAIFGARKSNMSTVDLQFKNANPLKMSDPETNKLIGQAVIKYFGSSLGCVRLIYLTFDIKIQIKDGKYKYDITNFDYTHYNPYNGYKITFNTLSDKGNCKSSGDIEDLIHCDNCSDGLSGFYSFIDKSVNMIISTMNEYILNYKPSGEW